MKNQKKIILSSSLQIIRTHDHIGFVFIFICILKFQNFIWTDFTMTVLHHSFGTRKCHYNWKISLKTNSKFHNFAISFAYVSKKKNENRIEYFNMVFIEQKESNTMILGFFGNSSHPFPVYVFFYCDIVNEVKIEQLKFDSKCRNRNYFCYQDMFFAPSNKLNNKNWKCFPKQHEYFWNFLYIFDIKIKTFFFYFQFWLSTKKRIYQSISWYPFLH